MRVWARKTHIHVLCLILIIGLGLAGCQRSAQATALPSVPQARENIPAPPVPTPSLTLSLIAPASAEASPTTTASPAPPPPATPDANLEDIKRFEPGSPPLVESGALLEIYRADVTLYRYQSSHWTYIVDPRSHTLLQIQPVEETGAQEGAPLSPAQLEQKARALVAQLNPGLDLSGLTYAPSSASGNYLFRWEDRARPLLDDGRSYPFIQVALNGSGALLNYLNTLPLGK